MDDASSIIPDDNHKHHHNHHNHNNHDHHNNIEHNQPHNQPHNESHNEPHNQPTARAPASRPTRRFSLFDNVKSNVVLPIQGVHNNVDHSRHSKVIEYFESIVEMVEPIEFYTVRQKAAPKAPSLIRAGAAFLLLFASIIIFALVVSNSLQTFTVETDIFRKLPQDLNDWDVCEPITTLGSNWTPFTL